MEWSAAGLPPADIDVKNMLCSTCRDLFAGRCRNVRYDSYRHHALPSMLETSARIGCYICGVLWRSFDAQEQARLRIAGSILHSSKIENFRYYWTSLKSYLSRVIMKPDIHEYTWRCKFSTSELVFEFGNPVWARRSFDLFHPDGEFWSLADECVDVSRLCRYPPH